MTETYRVPQTTYRHRARSLEQNTLEMDLSRSTTQTKSVPWAGGTASAYFVVSFPPHRSGAPPNSWLSSVLMCMLPLYPSHRIRLYSIKTFKPLGTLDYHKSGVQAVTFARNIPSPPRSSQDRSGGEVRPRPDAAPASVVEGDGVVDDDEDEEFSGSEIEARKRWLVVGGKDSRISVWELMDFAKPKP